MSPKTTNIAILFADVAGSTHLFETLGDATARVKVSDVLNTLTDVTKDNDGIVILCQWFAPNVRCKICLRFRRVSPCPARLVTVSYARRAMSYEPDTPGASTVVAIEDKRPSPSWRLGVGSRLNAGVVCGKTLET